MQPNSSRPVMDVARRPSMTVHRSSVRPAPALSRQPETAAPLEPKITSVPEVKQKTDRAGAEAKSPTPAIVPKSTMPVGIIVMSLLVMMVLIGLAVVIYLTS